MRNATKSRIGFESLESRQMLSVSLLLGGPQTVTPGLTVDASSDNSFGQSGMAIDANPTNPMNLAGIVQHVGGQNEIDIYRSFDGGNSWAKTAIDNGAVGFNDGTGAGTRFDPSIAFDDGGNLYVAYGNDTGTSTSVVVARSTDCGATFSQFRTLATTADIYNGTAAEIRGNSQFSLATGPDGLGGRALYITYVNSAIEAGLGLDQRVILNASNNQANTFLGGINVNNGSISGAEPGNYSPDVAVGPTGQAYVVWHNVNIDTGAERVMFDRDLDGRFVATSGFGLDGTVKNFANGSLLGWLVPAAPDHGVDTCPTIDVDRSGGPNNGRIYISYADWVSGSNTDIKVARSVTGGGGWTEFTVDNSPGTEFEPQISVDQHSGAVAIGYYSTKNDVATGNDDVQPFVAVSIDSAATFSSAAISSQTSNEAGGYNGDYGDHIGFVVRDGTAHALWASRHGAGSDLDALTSTVGFVSATGYNTLNIYGDEGGVAHDDYIDIRKHPSNSAFMELIVSGYEFIGVGSTLDQINVYGQAGNDQFRVLSTVPGFTTYLDGGQGDDHFAVDSLAADSPLSIDGRFGNNSMDIATGDLSTIDSQLVVYGDNTSDVLTLHDSNHAVDFGDYYQITHSTVDAPDMPRMYYGYIKTLVVEAGHGDAAVLITDGDANVSIHGDGRTAVNVGGGTIYGVTGMVSVDNVGGVTLQDNTEYQNFLWTLTDTTVGRLNFGGLTYHNVNSVEIYSGTGNDIVNVNSTAANIPVMLVDQGGLDTFNINETNATGPVYLPFGTEDNDSVNVNMDNSGSAILKFWGTTRIGHLSIGNGGLVTTWPTGDMVITVTSLNIPGSGKLDLRDDALIVDYSGSSPIDTIRSLITSGYFAGGWTGAGICSSTAAANSLRNTGLGFAEASQLGYTAFRGVGVDSTAILVRHTLYGDANLSGTVDSADFNIVASNFGRSGTGWAAGDFNFDTQTTSADFNLLAINFGLTL